MLLGVHDVDQHSCLAKAQAWPESGLQVARLK